uniref:Gamma-glutamyltransferase n=1 Tax=Ralstonia syzygii R24 TaxID=907261 RepID=G2ZZB8_9RALS|nr:hypothetical protein RALSY_10180 [Ralstonia syzygii R24]
MNWNLPFRSGRQPVLGRNVVATSQPLAAQAGAAALARGGNAIDAALAAAITLTVVEPVMLCLRGSIRKRVLMHRAGGSTTNDTGTLILEPTVPESVVRQAPRDGT